MLRITCSCSWIVLFHSDSKLKKLKTTHIDFGQDNHDHLRFPSLPFLQSVAVACHLINMKNYGNKISVLKYGLNLTDFKTIFS